MSSPTGASTVGFPGNYFEQALLEVAIARDVLTDAADFVRTQAPVPQGAGINRAADDPHIILRFGQFRARLHAAEGLLARATRLANATGSRVPTTLPAPALATAAPSPAAPATATSPTAPTTAASPAVPATPASPTAPTNAPSPAVPTAAATSGTARNNLASPAIPLAAPAPSRSSAHAAPPPIGTTPTDPPPPAGTAPTEPPPASQPSAAVLVALLEAQAFASDLITEIVAQLIAWGHPLLPSHHRRDTPGQPGLHTAPHWNYHHAGNYYLKGTAPPTPEPRP
jgi:hypothetical protein